MFSSMTEVLSYSNKIHSSVNGRVFRALVFENLLTNCRCWDHLGLESKLRVGRKGMSYKILCLTQCLQSNGHKLYCLVLSLGERQRSRMRHGCSGHYTRLSWWNVGRWWFVVGGPWSGCVQVL